MPAVTSTNISAPTITIAEKGAAMMQALRGKEWPPSAAGVLAKVGLLRDPGAGRQGRPIGLLRTGGARLGRPEASARMTPLGLDSSRSPA